VDSEAGRCAWMPIEWEFGPEAILGEGGELVVVNGEGRAADMRSSHSVGPPAGSRLMARWKYTVRRGPKGNLLPRWWILIYARRARHFGKRPAAHHGAVAGTIAPERDPHPSAGLEESVVLLRNAQRCTQWEDVGVFDNISVCAENFFPACGASIIFPGDFSEGVSGYDEMLAFGRGG
jgi:hypothetical protein